MFENIIGHEDKKKILEKCIKSGNISHAYLFSGKKGVGKRTLAEEFARQILNVKNLESSADYKYISKRDDKKDIIIEQIRKNIIDDVYELPVSGNKKVYIIDDAESLNIASQNALLKTLEEPPTYVVLILISASESVFLPTIRSRVNLLSFSGIKDDQLKKYMEENYKINLSDKIISYLEGSIGEAVKLIKEQKLDDLKEIDKLYEFINKKDSIGALKSCADIKFTEDMLDYLEYVIYINNKYSCVKFIERAKNRLKNNGNYDIVIDSLILKIIDNII